MLEDDDAESRELRRRRKRTPRVDRHRRLSAFARIRAVSRRRRELLRARRMRECTHAHTGVDIT